MCQILSTPHGEGEIEYQYIPVTENEDRFAFKFPDRISYGKPSIQDAIGGTSWTPYNLKKLLNEPTTKCRKLVAFGTKWSCQSCKTCRRDGHKYVCLDPGVAPIPTKCIVLSFGIGENMYFDHAMVQFNCTVYSFDMTLKNASHRAFARNHHLLLLGLADDDYQMDLQLLSKKTNNRDHINASMRSLRTIVDLIDRLDQRIDYIKMDIEYNEWEVFDSIYKNPEQKSVLDSVVQMGIELHLDDLRNSSAQERIDGAMKNENVLKNFFHDRFHLAHTELNTFSQEFEEVAGIGFALFRESLFIRR